MIEKKQFYIDGGWVDPVAGIDHHVIDPSTKQSLNKWFCWYPKPSIRPSTRYARWASIGSLKAR